MTNALKLLAYLCTVLSTTCAVLCLVAAPGNALGDGPSPPGSQGPTCLFCCDWICPAAEVECLDAVPLPAGCGNTCANSCICKSVVEVLQCVPR